MFVLLSTTTPLSGNFFWETTTFVFLKDGVGVSPWVLARSAKICCWDFGILKEEPFTCSVLPPSGNFLLIEKLGAPELYCTPTFKFGLTWYFAPKLGLNLEPDSLL